MTMFVKNGSVSDGDHLFGLGRTAIDILGVEAYAVPVTDCE
jgi:hypothetical protein